VKLRFTRRAARNIADIADYIHERSPAAAKRVRASIYASLQSLLIYPLIGRRQERRGVRKLVSPRYAYLVYYAIDETEGEIVILSVKHAAQERDGDDA
jgi:plasmid stabilization system protein ParE